MMLRLGLLYFCNKRIMISKTWIFLLFFFYSSRHGVATLRELLVGLTDIEAHDGCHGAAVICCQCNQAKAKRSGGPAVGHLTLSKEVGSGSDLF